MRSLVFICKLASLHWWPRSRALGKVEGEYAYEGFVWDEGSGGGGGLRAGRRRGVGSPGAGGRGEGDRARGRFIHEQAQGPQGWPRPRVGGIPRGGVREVLPGCGGRGGGGRG